MGQSADKFCQIYGFHPIFEKYYCAVFETPTWGEKHYFKIKEEMVEFAAQFRRKDYNEWANPKLEINYEI